MSPWFLFLAVLPLLLFIVFIVLLAPRRKTEWPEWTGLQGKTLWDFLNLLVVPAMLGSLALLYGTYDSVRQFDIENQREEAQFRAEENRTNEEILQSYFDDMADLILNYGLTGDDLAGKPLEEFNKAQVIGRARTLTALSGLDGMRNGVLIQFLLETNLFDLIKSERLEIDLRKAVLTEMDFSGASFNKSNFSEAVLVRSSFRNAFLLDVNFTGANLKQADLSGAALFRANLTDTDLTETTLAGAYYNTETQWPSGFDPVAAGAIETTVAIWASTLPK